MAASAAGAIRTDIAIAQALEARNDSNVDILLERRLNKVATVARRVGEIKRALDNNHTNNSICVASHRGTIGKTAFVCNDYDYDILFLAREPDQSIADNLRYIEEFAEDPLGRALTEAITLMQTNTVNATDEECIRVVFVDEDTGKVRKDLPILVMIAPGQILAQPGDSDQALQACLQ